MSSELRSVLTRTLGQNPIVQVDFAKSALNSRDCIVLCSDGLHGAVADEEIAATVSRTQDLAATTRELVSSANEQDGGDNVSVQLIRIRNVERMGMYRGRPYKLR